MSLRINAEAPNFTANTTQGTIDFHRSSRLAGSATTPSSRASRLA